MATRDPFDVGEIMRSTWSWACRPRDRCPRSAIYTPGYPAVEEGPSLLEDLPRRPPVVPDGNRTHPSAGNQMSYHAVRPFRYRVKKNAFLSRTRSDRPIDDFIGALAKWYKRYPCGPRSLSRTNPQIFIIIFIFACWYLRLIFAITN